MSASVSPLAVAPYGWMADGMTPFFPGVNCLNCGRFVGCDGALNIEYREMSSEIASLDGECAACFSASANSQSGPRP